MKKTWKWAACGYNLPYQDDSEIIEICRYAGITAIEANSSFSEGKSGRELEESRKRYNQAGIKITSFHLPMGEENDIASFYETVRRQVVNNTLRLMENAALLGSRIVILHPSTSRFYIEEEGLDRFLIQMGKTLKALLSKAEELNLVIALENMLFGERGRVGSLPEHFTVFAEKFGHPHLGFCLDTGHALVAGGPDGPVKFFEAMSKRLVAFHLHDNAGDRDSHLAPGHGNVDWRFIFWKMAEMKFSDSPCIEAPPFNYADNYKYSTDAWKKLIEETDTLAEKSIK